MIKRRLSGGCEDPVALGFADGRLFVAEREGRVRAIPLGGGEPETIAEGCAPAALASSSAAVWLAEATEEGALFRLDASGSRRVAGGLPYPAAVAVEGPLVLVACAGEDRDGGGLGAVPAGGGEPRWIARGLEGPAGVAAEHGTAWLLDAAGRLLEVPLGGGDARVVAPAEPNAGIGAELADPAVLREGGPYRLMAPSVSQRPVVAAQGVVAWIRMGRRAPTPRGRRRHRRPGAPVRPSRAARVRGRDAVCCAGRRHRAGAAAGRRARAVRPGCAPARARRLPDRNRLGRSAGDAWTLDVTR